MLKARKMPKKPLSITAKGVTEEPEWMIKDRINRAALVKRTQAMGRPLLGKTKRLPVSITMEGPLLEKCRNYCITKNMSFATFISLAAEYAMANDKEALK